jgi:hypothetical protein
MMSSKEELIKFIIDYSKEQPGLHDALQDFLLPPENSPGYIVVDEIIRSDIPHDLLHDIVAKLNELRQIENFEAYGLADINFLLLFATLKTSEPDEALQLLSHAIKEENNPFRCTEMVKTMLNILQKNGRTKEYRETVEKYLFLPEIMKIKYEWLATKKDWDGLLELLDKSIVDAERENRGADMTKLKEDKLHVYQLMHDSEKIIEMATELFYTGSEPMVKYHLLKKTIPVMEWPDFLDQLLSSPRNYPWRNVNAEIYIEEARWDKLMDWVWERINTTRNELKYIHHAEKDTQDIVAPTGENTDGDGAWR